MPLFCGITELPDSYKVCTQKRFSRRSAGWANRRVNRLARLNWNRAKSRVMGLVEEFEQRAFAELPAMEREASSLYRSDPAKAKEFLTKYSGDFARALTTRSWEVGDELWMVFARGN